MRKLPLLIGFLLLAALPLPAQTGGACKDFQPFLDEAAAAMAGPESSGSQAFVFFKRVASSAARGSDGSVGERIAGLRAGTPIPAAEVGLATCLLRRYLLARYGERMVKDLQEIVGFRTHAVEGQENWDAPEFLRQRAWLEDRARSLGLQFKSYDGRVDEITLAGPQPTLALLTHGDVEGVEGQKWSSPPFEAKLVDGKIVGRGTEDDKGPLVAALYVLAALRDTGWPLASTVRLLVANGEETSWEEIPYYLERAPMPDATIGLDSSYPVVHGQKGYGVLRFRPGTPTEPQPGKWRVVRMSGGSGLSIIPERGEALLEPLGTAREKGKAEAGLKKRAQGWAKDHPPARLAVSREGDLLKVVAEGRSGHSSEPTSGHNALGDLTAFLASLDLQGDAWGALALFTGVGVGTETDGKSLGIAHVDGVMGPLTSSLSFLREEKGAPVAEVNIRVPRGITKETIEDRLSDRTAAFSRRWKVPMTAETALLSEPHLVPAEGELVATLLAVWQEVTGKPGKPVSIGGGTQARLFKGGVDFGPAESMARYRGHSANEYLTPEELHRVAELTMAAVLRLATAAP